MANTGRFDFGGQEQRDGAGDTPAKEAREDRGAESARATGGLETGRIYDHCEVVDAASIEQRLGVGGTGTERAKHPAHYEAGYHIGNRETE